MANLGAFLPHLSRLFANRVILYDLINRKKVFPGGAVVKNPPASAADTGSSPGPGRSHVPQSK